AEPGRAVVLLQMAGEALDQGDEDDLRDFGNLDQGGVAEAVDAKPAGPEGELRLACEVCGIAAGEDESAGDRPLAGLGGPFEDVLVGLVETNRARQPHGAILHDEAASESLWRRRDQETLAVRTRRGVLCR